LLEQVWWRKTKWIILKAAIINGNKKWKAKNRTKVAAPTENPPHNHSTIAFPTYGTAETILVITAAAQKDICPHGRT